MGSPNKLNNALATVEALGTFKVGKFPERLKKKGQDESTDEQADTASTAETPATKSVVKKPTAPKAQAPKTQAAKAKAPKKDEA